MTSLPHSRPSGSLLPLQDKFGGLQLRSVIDTVGSAPDAAWAQLLGSGDALEYSSTSFHLALPPTDAAEARLLEVVDALTSALGGGNPALENAYRCWGWESPGEYFAELGSSQVMVVDVDHNDLDDRLAVLLLAWQMASANTARRKLEPAAGHACVLYLDARTYEGKAGETIWRTFRLAAKVRAALSPECGLELRVVVTDIARATHLAAEYLGVDSDADALDARSSGVGALLQGTSVGGLSACYSNWSEAFRGSAVVSLWLLGGLCAAQLSDAEAFLGAGESRCNVFEQAAPAWQSMPVPLGAEVQPNWTWPP